MLQNVYIKQFTRKCMKSVFHVYQNMCFSRAYKIHWLCVVDCSVTCDYLLVAWWFFLTQTVFHWQRHIQSLLQTSISVSCNTIRRVNSANTHSYLSLNSRSSRHRNHSIMVFKSNMAVIPRGIIVHRMPSRCTFHQHKICHVRVSSNLSGALIIGRCGTGNLVVCALTNSDWQLLSRCMNTSRNWWAVFHLPTPGGIIFSTGSGSIKSKHF